MGKDRLINDYLIKSHIRIKALYFYLEHKDYPDVVREAQEVVELLLKALLRSVGAEIPRIHDVGRILEQYSDFFPDIIKNDMENIKKISKELRKERELCFYGAEDFIPLEEYTINDAEDAIKKAEFVFNIVKEALG